MIDMKLNCQTCLSRKLTLERAEEIGQKKKETQTMIDGTVDTRDAGIALVLRIMISDHIVNNFLCRGPVVRLAKYIPKVVANVATCICTTDGQ